MGSNVYAIEIISELSARTPDRTLRWQFQRQILDTWISIRLRSREFGGTCPRYKTAGT